MGSKDLKRGDDRDPGGFAHPAGSVSCEWTGALADPAREPPVEGNAAVKPVARPSAEVEVKVRKPAGGHEGP